MTEMLFRFLEETDDTFQVHQEVRPLDEFQYNFCGFLKRCRSISWLRRHTRIPIHATVSCESTLIHISFVQFHILVSTTGVPKLS